MAVHHFLDRPLFPDPDRGYSGPSWVWERIPLETGWGHRMKDLAHGADSRRSSVSRRDFLRAGGLGVMALSLADSSAKAGVVSARSARNCIFLLMTGGPSQLDTFDPKSEAPLEYRGPLKSIPTAIPGVAFSETLPRLAQRASEFSLIRTLSHDAAPIHETGLQLLQTGRLSHRGHQPAHFGSLAARYWGSRNGAPASVVLPELLSETGVNIWKGQGAGVLGHDLEPLILRRRSAVRSESVRPGKDREESNESAVAVAEGPARTVAVDFPDEPESVRQRYGTGRFGELCLQARQCLEAGVRCITVNLFDSLNGQPTWDSHARGPWSPASIYDYRDTLGPQFDRAVSALLDDLTERGLLEETLVVATGEFGRTPKLNDQGGRDHWTQCWSALVAGGGVAPGRVVGTSDSRAASPVDRPVHPGELHATILDSLGIPFEAEAELRTPAAQALAEPPRRPVMELLA